MGVGWNSPLLIGINYSPNCRFGELKWSWKNLQQTLRLNELIYCKFCYMSSQNCASFIIKPENDKKPLKIVPNYAHINTFINTVYNAHIDS